MAIERTGSVVTIEIPYGSSYREGSQSITVPSDANFAVATFVGYTTQPDWMSDPIFSLNSVPFTQQARDCYQTSGDSSVAIAIETMVSPDTGSQTLAWVQGATAYAYYGPIVFIVFYKGVDETTPVKDGDAIAGTSAITGLTYASGDMCFGCGVSFGAAIYATPYSQTQIATDGPYRSAYACCGELLSSSQFWTTGGSDIAVGAIIIAEGAPPPVPTVFTGGITEGFAIGTGGSGGSDGAGGVNYTQFFAAAPGHRVYRYYAKLSAQTFPTAQDEYDLGGIASIQLNMESTWAWWWGRPSRLVISIPYSQEKINAISLRPMADIVLEMAVVIDGVEVQRETIITVDFTSITTSQTPDDSDITITGIRRTWNNSNLVELDGIISRSVQDDGRVQFRCARPDWHIRPGNRVDDDGDVIMIGSVVWSITPTAQSMDLVETKYPWEWY